MSNKLLSLLLCLCLSFLCLVSCKEGDREYDEAEVTAAAEILIEKSRIFNEIYWGAGISYTQPEDGSEPKGYLPADPEALSILERDYGIKDLETLKRKTREVFSEAGYNWIVSSCLTNIHGDTGVVSYARYYQATAENGGALMVYSNAFNIYTDTKSVEYLYDEIKVSAVKGEVLTVSLKVKTVSKNGDEKISPFTVSLIEEADGYRLHGATYATYN